MREIFEHVLQIVYGIGPVTVLPEKTRIALQVRMSFAGFVPRRHWLDVHVVLARRVENPRFRRIEVFSPRNVLHAFRLSRPEDVDDEVKGWLIDAYAVGAQHHLIRRSARTNRTESK